MDALLTIHISHIPRTDDGSPSEKAQGLGSLRDQIAQLQQKVDEIYQARSANAGLFQSPTDAQMSSEYFSVPSPCAESTDEPNNASSPHHTLDLRRYRSAIFQTTDTFVPGAGSASDIAIGSKIKALQNLHAKRSPLGTFTTTPKSTCEQRAVAVPLPKPHVLWSRLDDFFREFPCFFPFLREKQLRCQIDTLLESVEYTEEHCQVLISAKDCKCAAILFNMLAYAESVMESVSETDSNSSPTSVSIPGAENYCHGLDLMEYYGQLYDSDIETVIYHALSALFFFAAEKLQMALGSVSMGFHIARYIELNNQRRWPENVDDELACRQSLWWTLYFLDKRVSQKIGITYGVRQDECSVGEFIETNDVMFPEHQELLQSMIKFSHLWTNIWDSFFAPTTPTTDPREVLEVTDTRIQLAYRRIPPSLHWKSEELGEYLSKDSERQIRRRLLVWLRFTFLRLSIRHQHLQPETLDIQRRETCISICKDIVEAVQAYTGAFGCHKPTGYLLTSALVESLYWIENERQQPHPAVPEAKLDSLKGLAGKLLQNLALTVGAAARAYESLSDLLSTDLSALDSQTLDFSRTVSETNPQDPSLDLSLEGAYSQAETEFLPGHGFFSLSADDLVESAFDFSADVDWNALVNPLSSGGTDRHS
ncbi:hypothetical protein BDV18DRAFT_145959 [Aspergillus unguis]